MKENSPNFALIGAAGYIAPRHLQAIKAVGGNLIAATDKTDSVGIIDSYFPNASFFTEFERFDRYLDKLRRGGQGIDYLRIFSPHYLHHAHIQICLRHNAHVICEKPLVLNPWNLDGLIELENETNKKVFPILQLRLHPIIKQLKAEAANTTGKRKAIDLTYITSRGLWYYASWKGDITKSGGIATNIGIHFFDMLLWIYGPLQKQTVHLNSHDRASGILHLANADVRWFLSINEKTLPEAIQKEGKRTYRSITIDGQELEFSEGFTDLHAASFQHIMDGHGFSILDAKPAINLVHEVRNAEVVGLVGDFHPLARLGGEAHPFDPQGPWKGPQGEL